jgi:diguanylate cyclase (GGDEF)-like protein/PAS domain S-box-containing protein
LRDARETPTDRVESSGEDRPATTVAGPASVGRWLTAGVSRTTAGVLALVLLATVCLSVTGAIWASREATLIGQSTRAEDAYGDARAALVDELRLELAFLDTPSLTIRSAYGDAVNQFDAALTLARRASVHQESDLVAIAWLATVHASNVSFVDHVFDQVELHGVAIVATPQVSLEGPLETLDAKLGSQATIEDTESAHRVAALRHTERLVALITAGLVAIGIVLIGCCVRVIGGYRRLSEQTRQAAHKAERHSAERFRSLIEHGADLILVIGPQRAITYCSPAAQRLIGYTPDEMMTIPPDELIHPADLDRAEHARQRCSSNRPDVIDEVELRIRHKDGSWRWFQTSYSNQGTNPSLSGYVINAHDISDRKAAEATLAYSATHDNLTGLPNRALLFDRIEVALARSTRHGGAMAVLFCDLDRFKSINDSLGHDGGDRVLTTVAERFGSAIRPDDTVARLGGDEFVICCADLADAAGTKAVVGRLARSLAKPIFVNGQEIHVSASIGARLAQPGDNAEDLLRDADTAMYQAKQKGRGQTVIFDDTLRQQAQTLAEVETGLHQALERDELRLHYQPTVSVHTGVISGVEALLRWEHPKRGLLLPSHFIGVAEDTGLIVPIGEWVLDEACQQLRAWQQTGVQSFTMAVNISARQLRSPQLLATVEAIFARTGVNPADICLEVTESVLLDDADAAESTLRALKGLGVRLAIDDFGTGYSSLGYLRRFPVDMLKVDRSFVANLGAEAEATAIVTSVVHLAQALHLDTVAEGVETQEQRVQLDVLGCQQAQGYYWSEPVPAAELEPWLQAVKILPSKADTPPGAKLRVLIADDEDIYRQSLRRVLERSGHFVIVGEANDGRAAIEVARRERPDLVVLDLSMPTMGGLEALPSILADSPGTRVVLLSGHHSSNSTTGHDGASNCLRKGVSATQLVDQLLSAATAAA